MLIPLFDILLIITSRLENAEISWHLGHGLGKAKVHTNSYGKAHIYAPLGHLLALESKGHGCHSRLTIDEAHEGQNLILITSSLCLIFTIQLTPRLLFLKTFFDYGQWPYMVDNLFSNRPY